MMTGRKILLGVSRRGRIWEDYFYIKTELDVGWRGVDWTCVAQDRDQLLALGNVVMNILAP
jgi:hypothetical protein